MQTEIVKYCNGNREGEFAKRVSPFTFIQTADAMHRWCRLKFNAMIEKVRYNEKKGTASSFLQKKCSEEIGMKCSLTA